MARSARTADDADVRGLSAGQGGVVAEGALGDDAMSWASADGVTWTRAPDDPSLHPTTGREVRMNAVATTDGGWIAVGTEYRGCQIDCGAAAVRAMVWTSTDGLYWRPGADRPSQAPASMEGVSR